MRAFILFLTLSSAAFADEPTPAPTSAVNDARDTYKVALRSQLEKSGEDEAWGKCEAAKSSYLSMESELARINAELSVPANVALGQAQADYRAKLDTMRKAAEAKLVKAKTDAKTAGTELAAAEAKVKAINAELARIDAEEKREKAADKPTPRDDASGLGGLGARGSGLGGGSTMEGLGGLVGGSSWSAPSPQKSPQLPEEFKGCYPNETKSSS